MSGSRPGEADASKDSFDVIHAGTSQKVVIGDTSLKSTLFGRDTSVIRLSATKACFVKFGRAVEPTADRTGTSVFLQEGVTEYFAIDTGGETKLAVMNANAGEAGGLYITEGA